MANKIEILVEEIVEDLLKNTVYEVVDVEYVKEKNWYLRIYIDKDGGIGLDDCQEVSQIIDEVIENKNIISDKYILEVSSPGIDRVLKKAKDFNREMGKKVDINFYNKIDGKKNIVGVLSGFDGENIIINDNEKYSLKDISIIRLHIEF